MPKKLLSYFTCRSNTHVFRVFPQRFCLIQNSYFFRMKFLRNVIKFLFKKRRLNKQIFKFEYKFSLTVEINFLISCFQ